MLNMGRHEELELIGFGTQGMAKLTQVVNVLSTWGYIQVVRIKTKADPSLKIVVKKGADFQKNFDEFAAELLKRREEREQLKAEKKAAQEAAAEAAKEESTLAVADGEAKAEPAATEEKPEADSEAKADADESKA